MKIINLDEIKKINVSSEEYYKWIKSVFEHEEEFILPTKTRIPLRESDYFNVMPCVIPNDNFMGLKVVTRNQRRKELYNINLDAQILLYSYDTEELLAIMDGNIITTMRTAAVAVYSALNIAGTEWKTVAMVGLGNIGTAVGDIFFELTKDKKYTVKIFKYHGDEETFIKRFRKYTNLQFVVCDTYDELMSESDLIFSSVSYIADDFCSVNLYKEKCTIIPVHMRGFMECDRVFDCVITTDKESIKKFKYYNEFRQLMLLGDAVKSQNTMCNFKRKIIYNLGLATTDIYFAKKMYEILQANIPEVDFSPRTGKYI